MQTEYVYRAFERFWHWTQAVLIILSWESPASKSTARSISSDSSRPSLITTGAAIAFLVLIVFAIFWHFTTGEWRQYLPTLEEPAGPGWTTTSSASSATRRIPRGRHVLSKLNPLQKLVYAGLKVLVIPVMVLSGLLYMFYRYPQRYEVISLNVGGLEAIALVHTARRLPPGLFLHRAPLPHHHRLAPSTSNLKAMITGYEELPDRAIEQQPGQNSTEANA